MFKKSSLPNQLSKGEIKELVRKKGGELSEEDLEGQLDDFHKVRGLPIYTTGIIGQDGPFLFSFDKETIYNYWCDYPDNLTKEQIAIFDRAFPFWAEFRKH